MPKYLCMHAKTQGSPQPAPHSPLAHTIAPPWRIDADTCSAGTYEVEGGIGPMKESKRSTSPRAVFGSATRDQQSKVRPAGRLGLGCGVTSTRLREALRVKGCFVMRSTQGMRRSVG